MRNLFRIFFALSTALLAVAFISSPEFASAQTAAAAPALQTISLPAPQRTGGMPLMQALDNRKTTRAFADKPLPLQQLSNLLWAGFGVNRPSMVNPSHTGPSVAKPGRTSPSGQNRQDIQLYVVLAQGVYLYEPFKNELQPVTTGDQRAKLTTTPDASAHAAVAIVFVAPAKDDPYAQVDTGFIGQNIYLYAASEGLNAWFHAFHNVDVNGALHLPADTTPTYCLSVGYSEK